MANTPIKTTDVVNAITTINNIRKKLTLSEISKSGPTFDTKITKTDTSGLVDLINNTIDNDPRPVTEDGKPAQSRATAPDVDSRINDITSWQAYLDQIKYTREINTKKETSYTHNCQNCSKQAQGNNHKVTNYTKNIVSGYTNNTNTGYSNTGNGHRSTSYSPNVTANYYSCSERWDDCGGICSQSFSNSGTYNNRSTSTSNSTNSRSTTGNNVSTTLYSNSGAVSSYTHTSVTYADTGNSYNNTTNYDHRLYNSITG